MSFIKKLLIQILRLFNISHHDVYLLKSISHSGWVFKTYNPFDKSIPTQKFIFSEVEETNDKDTIMCERIINSYFSSFANKSYDEMRSKEWSRIKNTHQSELFECLNDKNHKKLNELFNSFLRTEVVYGIDTGNFYNNKNWKPHSLKLLSDLARLCEYLGISRAESGQGELAHIFKDELSTIKQKIETKLNIKIDSPQICGAYGLTIENSLITLQSPESVYVAHKLISDLFKIENSFSNNKKINILEIGGGYGASAYFIINLLKDSFNSYYLLDLPIINTMSAFYLGKIFGHNKIQLYGESHSVEKSIKIFPTTNYNFMEKVDLVFNQNSFPEIPTEQSKAYIEWMEKNADYFFSYNHESLLKDRSMAVTTVPEQLNANSKFNLMNREISWMRPGYIHEIYKIIK